VGAARSQSAALLPSLNELMEEAGRTPRDLTGVVACVGPGGFTSLRIGVATAEGLALTGLPTWGFSAFELRAKALRVSGHHEPLWILLDGQRSEVFAQFWTGGPQGPACKHPLETLPQLLQGRAWWAPGEFAAKVEPYAGVAGISFAEEGQATLEGLVSLCRNLPSRPPEAPLVPFYLRETDAEINFPEASRHLPDALRQGHAR
jgi:tRNA threonylcarbamoyladenosine biosynthesis protein TsaB